MSTPYYYFLPCVRRGVANEARFPEGGNPHRRLLDIEITIAGTNRNGEEAGTATEVKQIQVYGPGDVIGYNYDKLHTRVFPKPNAGNFESNFFPFVEFRAADFLWRFTPHHATAETKGLASWLTLIVLKQTEGDITGEYTAIESTNPDLPNAITVLAGTPLLDLAHVSKWSHAQISTSDALADDKTNLQMALNTPGQAVCRLMCPRYLEPNTKYRAFVVPTFEHGRLRGLGEKIPDDLSALITSWELNDESAIASDLNLPYYYSWEFRTGRRGDFEYLVRLLEPKQLDNLGKQEIDISNPGYGFREDRDMEAKILSFESALMSLDMEIDKWGDDKTEIGNEPFQKKIKELLSENRDKVIPPIYGRWHIGHSDDDELSDAQAWVHQLNTDPRHRFVAGLGVEVIKENQDDFMNLAWQQIGNLQEFNTATEKAKFSTIVLSKLHKRLRNLPTDSLINITQPVGTNIRGVLGEKSVYGDIQDSGLPNAVQDSTYRKFITRNGVTRRRQQKVLVNEGKNLGEQAGSLFERLPGVRAQPVPITILTPEVRPDGMVDGNKLAQEENEVIQQINAGVIGSWRNISRFRNLEKNSLERVSTKLHKLEGGEGFAVVYRIPASAISGFTARNNNMHFRTFNSRMQPSRKNSEVLVNGQSKTLKFPQRKSYASLKVSGSFRLKHLNSDLEISQNEVLLIDIYANELGSIGGQIKNGRNRPIVDARVNIVGFKKVSRTNNTGSFLLEDIPPGGHKIIITVGSKKMTQVVRIEEAEDLFLSLVFKSDPKNSKTLEDILAEGSFEEEIPMDTVEIPIEALKERLLLKTQPRRTVLDPIKDQQHKFINQFEDLLSKQKQEQLSPIMAHPVFNIPMYEYLRNKSQDYILIGLEKVKQNTIALLQTNRRFIEAYMLGLNHEFAAELAWRDYPTDMKGTFFQQFWDEAESDPSSEQKDIQPINEWNEKLGTNPSNEGTTDSIRGGFILNRNQEDESIENTVLLIRGELLNKYPNTLVYIVHGKEENGIPIPDFEKEALLPVFDGNLPPDVIFLGYNIPPDQIKYGNYFIVFEERISETRFGLDLESSEDSPDCIGNLSWEDFFPNQEGEAAVRGYLNNRTIEKLPDWNDASSAEIAKCTLQRPVRVIVHASRMIP